MWKVVLPLLAALFAVGFGAEMMTGGWSDADIDDEGVQNALRFAVADYNRASNDYYLHDVTRVVQVRSQVVAGTKYSITVEMARTSCTKNNVSDQCSTQSNPATNQAHTCTFTVWSRPWLNDIKVLKKEC